MANFGDFNFSDNNPSPDTDPVPDNDHSETESSTDGIQNDVANYPEPGEGQIVQENDPTEFAPYGNTEEPGAQQDHASPIIESPARPNTVSYKGRGGHVQRSLGPRPKNAGRTRLVMEPGSNGKEEPTLVRMLKRAKKGQMYTEYSEDGKDLERVYPLEDRGEEPYEDVTGIQAWLDRLVLEHPQVATEDDEDPTGLGAFVLKLADLTPEGAQSPVDFSYNAVMQRIVDAFNEFDPTIEDPTGLEAFAIKLFEAGFALSSSDVDFSHVGVMQRIVEAFPEPDWGADPTGLGDFIQLLINTGYTSTYGSIPNQNKKEPRNKRSSVQTIDPDDYDDDGNLIAARTAFDSLMIAGFNEDTLPDNSVDDPASLEEMDMLNIIDYVDSIDLSDMLDDVTQSSNLIDFLNPDALDGV